MPLFKLSWEINTGQLESKNYERMLWQSEVKFCKVFRAATLSEHICTLLRPPSRITRWAGASILISSTYISIPVPGNNLIIPYEPSASLGSIWVAEYSSVRQLDFGEKTDLILLGLVSDMNTAFWNLLPTCLLDLEISLIRVKNNTKVRAIIFFRLLFVVLKLSVLCNQAH